MKKIIITGGTGRFGQTLKKYKSKYELFFPSKKQLNILNFKSSLNYLKKIKPNYLVHLAGLSRPMNIHDKEIEKSIDLNIIGTSNITKLCSLLKIKLIYFSTNYVYPGVKGNYSEKDALLPVNNYAWSKLGGESAVHLYKNSLILRVSMTEKPFVHKRAFVNVKSNFLYHEDVIPILFRLLDKRGIINIGGPTQSIFHFAKKENKQVKKAYLKKNQNIGMPYNSSMSLKRLKIILKKKD